VAIFKDAHWSEKPNYQMMLTDLADVAGFD
jgi:ATP-dependent DNA helicase RecG